MVCKFENVLLTVASLEVLFSLFVGFSARSLSPSSCDLSDLLILSSALASAIL